MQLNTTFLGGQRFAAARVATATMPNSAANGASRSVTCMAKKKGVRLIVTLECTEARAEGGTPTRYASVVAIGELGYCCSTLPF